MPSLSVQLAVLAELEEPASVSEVSQRLGIEEFEVEEAVSELEAAGLVEREGFGVKTRLVPATPELARLAGAVRGQLSTPAWQALFAAGRAELAHVVDQLGRLEAVAALLDEPVAAVEDDVYRLLEVGVLEGEQSFRLGAEHGDLAELLARIDALRARRFTSSLDADAELVWHLGPEALVGCEAEVTHPDVTYGGPSLFEELSGEPVAPATYHQRTLRDLDAADAIFGTLLALEPSEELWSRCTRLYRESSPPTFREKADVYGLEDAAERILERADGG